MERNSTSKKSDHGDSMKLAIRVTAACAALGGTLLTAFSLYTAALPEGLPEGPYRDAGVLYALLFLPAMICISGSALGLYYLHPKGGKAVKVVRIAALIAAASFFFGTTGFIIAWYVGVVLVYVSILAFVVTGVGLLTARTMPSWAGALLAVTSLLVLGFNTEDSRVLFLVPFGLNWIVLSGLLAAGKFRSGALPSPNATAIQVRKDQL